MLLESYPCHLLGGIPGGTSFVPDGVLRCLIARVAARCHDAAMHTTNYVNTLITVSPDTKAAAATATLIGTASVAELQAGRECVTSW